MKGKKTSVTSFQNFFIIIILLSSKILFAKPCIIDEMQIVTLEKCYVEYDNGSIILNGQFKNGKKTNENA